MSPSIEARLQGLLLRGAASIVPRPLRDEWFAEWKSELWYVRRSTGGRPTAFCLGAWADAAEVRRSYSSPVRHRKLLDSPVHCMLLLASLAAMCALFAFRFGGPRGEFVFSSYRETSDLVMVKAPKRLPAQFPNVTAAEYELLGRKTDQLFARRAFYRPVRRRVETGSGGVADLRLAIASRSMLDVLDLPGLHAPGMRGPFLILHHSAWRRYFAADGHLVGRAVPVSGIPVPVAAITPPELWRLPGYMDGWLIGEGEGLTVSPETKGYVVARLSEQLDKDRAIPSRIRIADDAGDSREFHCVSLGNDGLIRLHLLMVALALLILPGMTRISLGEYPPRPHVTASATRLRRWIFLGAKLALLLVIVFCGILILAHLTSSHIQAHGFLTGYVLAFCWALSDQRKRCPVCLPLLARPIRIGSSSRTFLEWYGTELVCVRGHGLLHIPGIETSCYRQRWMYLDESWAILFEQAAKKGSSWIVSDWNTKPGF